MNLDYAILHASKTSSKLKLNKMKKLNTASQHMYTESKNASHLPRHKADIFQFSNVPTLLINVSFMLCLVS